MGFLLRPELLIDELRPLLPPFVGALALVLAAGLGPGCGPAGGGGGEGSATEEGLPDTIGARSDAARSAPVLSDTFPPPVANGRPMPPAGSAAGIVPYPTATVWVRDPSPRNMHRIEAFTPDPQSRVVEFYRASLPDWEIIEAGDMVIFEKGSDEAAVTISPWEYGDLPPDAPPILRDARTAIGAAWR